MKSRILLIAGLSLLTLAAAWKFALAPHWTQRLPPGWSWQANYIGISTYPDPLTGEFPPEDNTATYQRSIRIVSEIERPRVVKVKDAYIIRDIASGKVTWEYNLNVEVNPATGEYLVPEAQGQYIVFPRQVEKKPMCFGPTTSKASPLNIRTKKTSKA